MNVYVRTLQPLLFPITFFSVFFFCFDEKKIRKMSLCSNYILKSFSLTEWTEKRKRKKKTSEEIPWAFGLDPFKCKYYGICRLWHGSYSILFINRKTKKLPLGLIAFTQTIASDSFTTHYSHSVIICGCCSLVIIY